MTLSQGTFYGGSSVKNHKKFNEVKLSHIKSALFCAHVAEKNLLQMEPNIIFNNMNVYSTWQPIFGYFEKKRFK